MSEADNRNNADSPASGEMVTQPPRVPGDATAAWVPLTPDQTYQSAAGVSPPERIGPWVIQRLLGEGGFGVVYQAERQNPAQRAALKLVRPGMDSRAVLARFEAERQALALLAHPNIARLYEAGIHEGRPYFAMEFVPGLPITEYAERNGLSTEERLRLFQQVCLAVQHAHLKAIIHRDISARNVLVTEIDGKPAAKVIDFGIAKAVGITLTDSTIDTGVGNIIGNYAYMSPEQAAGDADIDARTDVYSLGVLLYELLTGERPFDNDTIQKAGDFGIRKLIVETEPPRPSTRTASAELNTVLRRELEWIPLKALRKDRTRRYQSPHDFADDIQNYLDKKPLTAGPESRLYRVKKYSRRHRAPLAAAAAVLAVVIGGTVFYVRNIRAEQARTLAALVRVDAEAAEKDRQRLEAERQRDLARAAQARAVEQSQIATAVLDFQNDMLSSVSPGRMLGENVTVVQAISAATRELDAGKLKGQPLVEASVRTTIASTLRKLAEYDQAEASARRSVELLRSLNEQTPTNLANALLVLADILRDQGRYADAEKLHRESLDIFVRAHPQGHADVSRGLGALADGLLRQDRFVEAESLYRQALEMDRKLRPTADLGHAGSLDSLAKCLQYLKRLDESEPLYLEALNIRRELLPPGHPQIASTLASLASLRQAQKRYDDAELLYRESLQLERAAFPKQHPTIATSLGNLATLLDAAGKPVEAEKLHREALAMYRATLPAGHADIARSLNNIGAMYLNQKRYDEAEAHFRESVALFNAAFPVGHFERVNATESLSGLYLMVDKYAEAEPMVRELLALERSKLPSSQPAFETQLLRLTLALLKQDKFAEAVPYCRELIDAARAKQPPDTDSILFWGNLLGGLHNKSGNPVEAEVVLTNVLDLRRKSAASTPAQLAADIGALASTKRELLKFPESETLYREQLDIERKIQPAKGDSLAKALSGLAQTLLAQGRLRDAEPLFTESLALRTKSLGPTHPTTYVTAFYLSELLDTLARPEDAAALRTRYRLGDATTRASTQPK